VWVYKGDTLGRNEAPLGADKEALPAPEKEDRRTRRAPGAGRPGQRGPRRRADGEAAPGERPAEAAAEAPKATVKRVRKVAGTPAGTDKKGE
jgi:small subunit ribosomal protein S3